MNNASNRSASSSTPTTTPGGTGSLPLSAALHSSFLCFLFGGNPTAIKICSTSFGPLTMAGSRFLLAALTLILWGVVTGQEIGLRRDQLRLLLPLPFIFTIQLTLFYLGQTRTLASHGAIIANLLPLMVMLSAHFILGDRITLRKTGGLLVGFAAVVLLFIDRDTGEQASLAGDLLILGAVVLWSINVTVSKRIIDRVNILTLTLYPMLLASPVFIVGGWLFDSAMITGPTASSLMALSYQAFVTASYGFISWNRLLKQYGATALNAFIFLMPVSGVLLGVVLLGEPLTVHLLAAIVLVVASLLIINRPKSPARHSNR